MALTDNAVKHSPPVWHDTLCRERARRSVAPLFERPILEKTGRKDASQRSLTDIRSAMAATALTVVCCLTLTGQEGGGPSNETPPLTAEQKAQLQERDRMGKQATKAGSGSSWR